MRAALGLALLALALAGCTAPPGPGPSADDPGLPPRDTPPAPPIPSVNDTARGPSIPSPTWALGDAWTYTLRNAGGEVTHELVVFRADDEHWWLGLEDRALALEHALRDTNPLIGRIHYGILSPHERGRHVGMYSFPIEDGKVWSGDLFGGTWQFRSAWDAARQRYDVVGTGVNASRITLDYDPAVKWFSALRVERDGATEELLLQDHRAGLKGAFHFLRGVDVYEGPGPAGPLSAAVQTDEVAVEAGFDALGVSLRLDAAGPGAVVLLDPTNQERWRRDFAAGEAVDEMAEVEVAAGTWRVVYLGLAGAPAEVRLAGLEVHTETV